MFSFSMDPPQPLPPHSEGTPIVVMTGIPKAKAEQLAQVWNNSAKSYLMTYLHCRTRTLLPIRVRISIPKMDVIMIRD